MELTGYDTVIVTPDFDATAAAAVVREVARMWPDARVNEAAPEDFVFAEPGPGSDQWPEILAFCRDSGMDRHWDEFGYTSMPDGEGPFAVYYGSPRPLDWDVTYRHDRLATGAQPEPHTARVMVRACRVLTVLTPGDPADDPFSARIVDLVTTALR